MPKVSIGLPVYNGARFLPDALRSILSQEFQDFEVIISDNASDDGTEEIGRSFSSKDPRVHYHRNASNLGLVTNFNKVFELATGVYFKWSASDDLLEPDYLLKTVQVLDADPSVVLACSAVKLVEADGSPVHFDVSSGHHVTQYGEELQSPDFPSSLSVADGTRRFRDIVMKLRGNPLASCIYGLGRRENLADALPMRQYLGSEKVFLARLSLEGRFHVLDDRLYVRRFHPEHFGMRSPREATKLINPGASKLHMASGQQLYEYFRAVTQSSLSFVEKMKCYAVLAEKVIRVALARTLRLLRRDAQD